MAGQQIKNLFSDYWGISVFLMESAQEDGRRGNGLDATKFQSETESSVFLMCTSLQTP